MEDEKPDEKTADNLELPTSLGRIGSKLQTPPMMHRQKEESAEFMRGYKEGYADKANGKDRRF